MGLDRDKLEKVSNGLGYEVEFDSEEPTDFTEVLKETFRQVPVNKDKTAILVSKEDSDLYDWGVKMDNIDILRKIDFFDLICNGLTTEGFNLFEDFILSATCNVCGTEYDNNYLTDNVEEMECIVCNSVGSMSVETYLSLATCERCYTSLESSVSDVIHITSTKTKIDCLVCEECAKEISLLISRRKK